MRDLRHILLAEDDDQYACIIQFAFKKAGIENPVDRLTSRQEVIGYMSGEGRYADRASYPLPGTIILGLRLPLEDDFEALRWVRLRSEFADIHIIVLSGVEYHNERGIAMELGADSYKVKPLAFTDLVHIAERIRDRWLEPDEARAAA
jgi:DNA-binding response OmpR family regulator